MARYCDDCIHAGICKFESSFDRALENINNDFINEDLQGTFAVCLTCSKKTTTLVAPTYPSYRKDYNFDSTISTYPED